MTQTKQPGKRHFRWYGGGRRGWSLVKYGMVWFGIGLVITVATYAFAVSRGGGTYLVSYGPMVVGLVSMVRGGIDMARERRAGGSATGGTDTVAFAQSPGYDPRAGAMPDGGIPGGGPRLDAMSTAGTVPRGGSPGGAAGEPAYGAQGPAYDAQGNEPWQRPRNEPRHRRPAYDPTGQADATPPQPNWYPDPHNPTMLRWWDGQIWTNHTRPYN